MGYGFLNHLAASWRTHSAQWRALGVRGWLQLQMHLRSPRLAAAFGHRLWPKTAAYPVRYRPGESDLAVFWQIFLKREYACLSDIPEPGLIIDCGANVGYSTVYLLTRFPNATAICLEPDEQNFALLEENTRPFRQRVRLIRAAVWSRPGRLRFAPRGYRGGAAWAIQVQRPTAGEVADVPAVDLATVLRDSGHDRVGLLKVDIERAELEVFGPSCQKWLGRCDNIVIELHDPECERTFAAAIAGHRFRVSHSGELTVCRRTWAGDRPRGRAVP